MKLEICRRCDIDVNPNLLMLRFLSQMFTLSQPMFVCSSVAEVLMQDHSIPKGHTHTLELKRPRREARQAGK